MKQHVALSTNIPITGQRTISDENATQLTSSLVAATNYVILQSKSTNSGIIFIGTSGGQFYELFPGDSVPMTISRMDYIYYKGDAAAASASDKLTWIAL